MPKRSDSPYPEAVYSQIHDASTCERYQKITVAKRWGQVLILDNKQRDVKNNGKTRAKDRGLHGLLPKQKFL
jgi:hypothetical protein